MQRHSALADMDARLTIPGRGVGRAMTAIVVLLTVAAALGQPFAPPSAATQPGGGPSRGPGGGGPGGGARGPAVAPSGVYTLDGATATAEKQAYTSGKPNVSAIYVKNGGVLALIEPTVTMTGNSTSHEDSSFYGVNAAILAGKGSKISITGGSVTTSGDSANGVFAVGEGAEITLSKVSIQATGPGAHGVMATLGGKLTLQDVDITTAHERAGAVATDRGGGTINVSGGVVKTAGRGSPGIYSTGRITASGGTYTATGAEAVVIEGSNSVTLTDCQLSGARRCGVMVYQSFSGDAQGRKGTFTMTGGSLTATAGPLFFVTNTTAIIKLSGVKLTSSDRKLFEAGADRWGRSGSNGGTAFLTAEYQALVGDLTADKLSTITVTLAKESTLTGSVNRAALTLDSTSKWIVTGDSVVTGLTIEGASSKQITGIEGNGHTVRYDPGLPANRWLEGKTVDLPKGGRLAPAEAPPPGREDRADSGRGDAGGPPSGGLGRRPGGTPGGPPRGGGNPRSATPPTFTNLPYGNHPRQVLDFYQAKSDTPTPAVLYIHGGGWQGGDKRGFNSKPFLDSGISVVTINYRFVQDGAQDQSQPPVKVPLEDAARALQFVRSKAAEWNLDRTRIGATGDSSGGSSALWLAFHDDLADPTSNVPIARESTRLYCAAVDDAQTSLDPKELREWMPNYRYGAHAFGLKDFQSLIDSREKVLTWIKQYSPIELVSPDDPPVGLFYQSGKDTKVGDSPRDPTHSPIQGLMLEERLKKAGVDVILVYPGRPHAKYASSTDYLIDRLRR